jgi:hypothetical protein
MLLRAAMRAGSCRFSLFSAAVAVYLLFFRSYTPRGPNVSTGFCGQSLIICCKNSKSSRGAE